MDPLTADQLDAGLDHVRGSPREVGIVEMIVCRPHEDEREVVDEGELDLDLGLVGDNWKDRGSPGGAADPERQLTLMNSRLVDLVARSRDRWALAGDQIYVDLDLGIESLPPGARLRLGSAVIEVSEAPHTGCAKFSRRFGLEAYRLVNSDDGKRMRLRGVNARVVQPGAVRTGDEVRKL